MIVTEAVSRYLSSLRSAPDPVLEEMERHGARYGVPIVVPETGALLQLLTRISGAERVVEVGTAIGVSTLYMARALPERGRIVTFEIDEQRQRAAAAYLERAGVLDRVELRLEDARSGLQGLGGQYDMAFIDGVKAQYENYFELLVPLLAPGALLVVDNVLMGGSVAEGLSNGHWSDEQITGARAFNERVLGDDAFAGTVLPVGDGVLIAARS